MHLILAEALLVLVSVSSRGGGTHPPRGSRFVPWALAHEDARPRSLSLFLLAPLGMQCTPSSVAAAHVVPLAPRRTSVARARLLGGRVALPGRYEGDFGVAARVQRGTLRGVLSGRASGRPGPRVRCQGKQEARREEVEDDDDVFLPVPLRGQTVAATMVLWSVSTGVVGFAILPLVVALFGVDLMKAGPVTQTEFLLLVQATETLVTYAVISVMLSEHLDGMIADGWFSYSGGPDKNKALGENGWLRWAGLGMVSAFGAIAVSSTLNDVVFHQEGESQSVTAIGGLIDSGRAGTTDQLVMVGCIFAVASILAPLTEEAIFRGFLLPALNKWVPLPGAVALSSAAFALAHLNPHDFIPLFSLGCILGSVYVQTKDLRASTMVHALWNSGVIILLLVTIFAGDGSAQPMN